MHAPRRYVAVHHPFTAPHPDDMPSLLSSSAPPPPSSAFPPPPPEASASASASASGGAGGGGGRDHPLTRARAIAYDLVYNGVEVGGGSLRIYRQENGGGGGERGRLGWREENK
jgi:aspartyl-tRNA synthetase